MARPLRRPGRIKVIYDEGRWKLLATLRNRAMQLMEALHRFKIWPVVHGSVARGDVTSKSDVDVFVPHVVPSYLIESALDDAGIQVVARSIVQATPAYVIKALLEVDERTCVSFPLVRPRPREIDFYKFGGQLDLDGLCQNRRVPGVDKRLMLIEPTRDGHVESSVIGRESEVAGLLGVRLDIVEERVKTLLRRGEVGRTGIFLTRKLAPDESFEGVLRDLARTMPSVRKRVLT